MEQGFSLPATAFKKVSYALAISTGIGLVIFLIAASHHSRKIVASSALIMLVLIACIAVFIRRYRYVFLSESGIRGRPISGVRWETVGWNEHLDPKPAKLGILNGRLFSTRSGSAIFIPQSILEDRAFLETAARFAPAGHPFRRASTRF